MAEPITPSVGTTVSENTQVANVYEPTVWKCGDNITEEKLNKVENRLAFCGGVRSLSE